MGDKIDFMEKQYYFIEKHNTWRYKSLEILRGLFDLE
jgi:hypothetical protein